MEIQPSVRNRARAMLFALLLIGALLVVLGGAGTSLAQSYSEPSSPPTDTQTSAPPTSPPVTSPPVTSPPASCPPVRAASSQGETCPSPSDPPINRGDGPNVEENELFPHFNDGPNVLDQDPISPEERGATTPGGSLPFTGADLTLIVLLGGAAITLGVILVRSRRRTRTAA